MNATELLDALHARGLTRTAQSRPGAIRAAVIGGIEVAISESSQERHLRAKWRERVGTTGTPYLLIADQQGLDGVVVALGPISADGPIRLLSALDISEMMERAAGMSPLDAVRFVTGEIDRLDQTGIAGVRLKGLLTVHTLDVRLRGDTTRWGEATSLVKAVPETGDWRSVLSALGYELERRPHRGWLARHEGRPIAVVHPKADAAEFARLGADGRPAEGVLISDCHADGARYGIMTHDSRLRLFDAESDTSTAAWVDIDAVLLSLEDRPFLALLGPEYLAEGKLQNLRDEARAFGSGLRERLDETIRHSALPALAAGLDEWARAKQIDPGDDEIRQSLEKASLTLLFRLLFILYAESAGFLPISNHTYRGVSLTALVQEASETIEHLGPHSRALWDRFRTLVHAMRSGNPAWDVPAYNGALFAEGGFEGAELLEDLDLADPHFARVLIAVGRDPEIGRGVDYSTLDIGHLGHIYEALLGLRLSVAATSLRYDSGTDRYVADGGSAEIAEGSLLWQTHEGGRKAGGVYYTRAELVRHLVDRAVLPAFERHLDEVRRIAESDPIAATERLLQFAVLDPACGSAHFLVHVMERLAERTVLFLADRPLPEIGKALDRLRAGATPRSVVDDVSLLRRLILKHCVFGVDVSPMGAEVATLSLWLSSFVPGLSLAYLGRNIVVGNSLIGVARPSALRASRPVPKKGKLGDFHPEDLGDEEPFFQSELDAALEVATAAMVELADIDDRTPDEYEASRVADGTARDATRGLKRVFDLWTAASFGLSEARLEVVLNGADIIAGAMTGETEGTVAKAEAINREHSFLHWPLEFPRVFSRSEPGFDVVVGNPPWEEITVERLAFLGLYQPGLRSLPEVERERAIEVLLTSRPELAGQLEQRQQRMVEERAAYAMGEYESLTGDPDLYKYFCQRYRTLVRPGGLLGVVLPRAAFVNDGSESFRHWLFEGTTTSRLDFLLNRRNWIFATHPQYTIALVVAKRSDPEPDHQVEVAGTATSLDEWNKQSASEGLRIAQTAFGPGWITPLLRSQEEADLLAKVRVGSRFPFGSSGRWRCFPVAELHETNDKELWRDATNGLPLWKGESFDQFNPHGAEARLCPTSDAVWNKVRGPRRRPGAGSALADSIPLGDRRRALVREVERARVAFRDVSRATDSRTVRACLIPADMFLTNKAPYLVFIDGEESAQAACLGVMNSLPFDWQARRFVEINLNFFLLEGLIVPDLSDDDYREISRASARLSAVDDRFSDFARETGVDLGPLPDDERQELLAEIDARVAHAWQLTPDDLDVMFGDFTLDAVPIEYRQAVASRLAELGG